MTDERKSAQDNAESSGFLHSLIQWLLRLLGIGDDDSPPEDPDPQPEPDPPGDGGRGGAYGKGVYSKGPYAGDDDDSPGENS